MALRARLVAPPPAEREVWPYHQAKVASLPVHLLWGSDRRMEAENYLASGYGIRLAIQEREHGWVPLSQFARVWQPNRLKGILVSPSFGTPFLAATQVFDIRPIPRKWLALERTHDSINRFVMPGTILVTCSGAVGRATLATDALASTLITHDLLRVEPNDSAQWGWVYAYLRSSQARAMMGSAQYGHIIKHLETSHLDALPVPEISAPIADDFRIRITEILALRNRASLLDLEAEQRFQAAIGPLKVTDWGESGYSVAASSALFQGRRRMEGCFHNPGVAEVDSHLAKGGRPFQTVQQAGYDVWLPNRFKRIPAADGIGLVDSSSVFEINPDIDKRIADGDFGDPYNGRIQAGWLVMARSGQTYGLNGTTAFVTKAHEDKIVSDDLLRIAPRSSASFPAGYLYVALSHPVLGRPRVKALAYGSSIPHVDAKDLLDLSIPRLLKKEEQNIGELAEDAARLRATADINEIQAADDATKLIDRFIAGESLGA